MTPAQGEPQREIDLSRAWFEGRLPAEMHLVGGQSLQIIYRGVWSNANGPDFKSGMIAIDGTLLQGAIEIHIRASDWFRHRHDENAAYNDVILHVVYENDLPEPVTSPSGRELPTLEVARYVEGVFTPEDRAGNPVIAALGTQTCLPTLGRTEPELVREALRQRGWSRMAEKQLRFGQSLQVLTAPEVLYQGLLDALGYSNNREPMQQIGTLVPLQLIEKHSTQEGAQYAAAVLLGAGGFLSDLDRFAALTDDIGMGAVLQRDWDEFRGAYRIEPLSTDSWTLNRVRPSNHPIRRLASLASLIDRAPEEGLYGQFMALELDGGGSWERWLSTADPPIGKARRAQIAVNIFAPFLAAYADVMRDEMLGEEVAELWENLHGSINDHIARSTRDQILGDTRFPIRKALEEQGLHDIYRNGCSELRCFECPIARLAVEHEPWESYLRDQTRSDSDEIDGH